MNSYNRSEDYYEGQMDMAQRCAEDLCEKCGAGYTPQFNEEKKQWIHSFLGDLPDIKCQAPNAWFLHRQAEKDKSDAYLKSRYGTMWNIYYTMKDDWIPGKQCHCCGEDASQLCDCNCWGTVSEFFACDECAEKYDGKCMDSLPKYEPKEVETK